MPKLTPQLLQRYHDGELSAEKAARIEAELQAHPEAQRTLEKNERLGELLRLMSDEMVTGVSFEELGSRVRDGIARSVQESWSARARIWLREYYEHRRRVWIPAAALVGAAAVALFVLPTVVMPPSGQPTADPRYGIRTTEHTPKPAISRIDSVNFGDLSGKKLSIADENGSSIGVVWINEER